MRTPALEMPVPAKLDTLIFPPEELVMVPGWMKGMELLSMPVLEPVFDIVIVPELVRVPEVVRVPPLKMPVPPEFDIVICPPEELASVPTLVMPRKLEFDIVIVPPERLKTLLSLSILMPEPLLFTMLIVPELSISPPEKPLSKVLRLLMPALVVPEFDMVIVPPGLFTIKP